MLALTKKALSVIKKVFIVVAVYFIVINLFLYLTQKDAPKITQDPVKESRKEIDKNLSSLKLNETKQGKAFLAVYQSTLCKAVGEACTSDLNEADKYFGQSLVGGMAGLITYPYVNPPASGVYWVYNSLQHSGFVPKSFAAEGIGFAGIKPLSTLWKVFRDAAYLLLVMILITVGFMVMFRTKINPQTVITMENSLPRIILSLILITFSFPIAGFLIDLMYVLIVIGIAILSKADPSLAVTHTQNSYIASGMGKIWDSMFPVETGWSRIPLIGGLDTLISVGNALVGVLPAWINDSVRALSVFFVGSWLFHGIWNVLPGSEIPKLVENIDILGTGLGRLPGGVLGTILKLFILFFTVPFLLIHGAGYIIGLLVFFTILFLLFRIFFLLLTAYLKALLFIILSPFILLLGAIPGKNFFSRWIRGLTAELLVFPMVILLLILGRILVNIPHAPDAQLWKPPFLHNIAPRDFSVLIGMGLIFLVPELVKFMKEKVSGSKGVPFGAGLGTFFAGAGAGVGGAFGISQKYYYAKQMPGLRNIIEKLPFGKETRQQVAESGERVSAPPGGSAGGPVS